MKVFGQLINASTRGYAVRNETPQNVKVKGTSCFCQSFQKALSILFVVGRVFGLFPHLNIIGGWRSRDLVLEFRLSRKKNWYFFLNNGLGINFVVNFRWLSWCTMYSCVKTVFACFYSGTTVWGTTQSFPSLERLNVEFFLKTMAFTSFTISVTIT